MPYQNTKKFAQDTRGVSAIEFAILGPVFLAGIFGVIFACSGLFAYSAMQASLSAGQRSLYFDSDDQASAEAAVRAVATDNNLREENLGIVFVTESSPFHHVEIQLTYSVPLFAIFGLGETLTLKASKLVPVESS